MLIDVDGSVNPPNYLDAEHTQEEFGDSGKLEDGILFRTPRLVILRGGYKDDPTFVEKQCRERCY